MHEYFPGANTPQGFFSYYQYILPPEETNQKIILKGGPGTGKSSLMKKVAALLRAKGYKVNLLHCSSDPDSLDAIVAPSLGFCMLDGTAPHVVDPSTPGATDTILHLGQYWDAAGIRKHKEQIRQTSKEISACFANAYDYLRAAGSVENYIRKETLKAADETQITKALNALMADLALGADFQKPSKIKKAFLTGFTPKGNISYIDSFATTADRVIQIKSEADTAAFFTNRLAERIIANGKAATFFYCPLQPDKKIEHIYLPKESIFITTSNTYHACTANAQCVDLNAFIKPCPALRADTDILNILLSRAISCIKNAKVLHDKLEQFYIPYMDFDAMTDLPHKIVSNIL